jgi:toxin-antitoxin system PIN domain toxin
VIVLDANILITAHLAESAHHAAVNRWTTEVMARREEIGLPWVVILAFLRVITNPAPFQSAISMKQAQEVVGGYLSRSHVLALHPTPTHWRTFKDISGEASITHRHVTDAHIAALTIEHDAELCTLDRDFRRFKGLKLIDPLAA